MQVSDKTIAVLPFENLGAEKEHGFFADGIQDDVLTKSGQNQRADRIARASVMVYRRTGVGGNGDRKDARGLARPWGSVRSSANR